MKTYKNLYEKICSFENLLDAYRGARKGKRSIDYVGRFELGLEQELLMLKQELESETYRPSPLHRFVVRDPKTRVIHAPAFRDRVVHHAICNVLEPIFDKTFIYDSYASRKCKGMHAALERFDEFKRKVSRNGSLVPHAVGDNMVAGWCLKADIRHYFPSIDHGVLLGLLSRKVRDCRVLELLRLIIESYAPKPGKGMPLGALTSQLFANVYLNPLDHFVKERLHAKYYIRYLDDFVILDRSREHLERIKAEVERLLRDELKLELHPEKTSIFPMHRGVSLLGFRCFYHHRLLRKSTIGNFLRKMNTIEDENERRRSIEGWLAHAAWGNTYRLRTKFVENIYKPQYRHAFVAILSVLCHYSDTISRGRFLNKLRNTVTKMA